MLNVIAPYATTTEPNQINALPATRTNNLFDALGTGPVAQFNNY